MNIEHVAAYFNDLEAAREFFYQVLWCKKAMKVILTRIKNFRSYFLTFDSGARLEIMNKPDLDDPEKTINRTGYIHVAFSLGSKEMVDELTELIAKDGYKVISGPRTTGDGYYESCVTGVEGMQIELTV
jgi:Glyoxalase/Bleomycin resistance protein/Dioxygenase superfamily.